MFRNKKMEKSKNPEILYDVNHSEEKHSEVICTELVSKKDEDSIYSDNQSWSGILKKLFSKKHELFFPIYPQEYNSWSAFTAAYREICKRDIIPKVHEFIKKHIKLKPFDQQFIEMDLIENSLDSIANAYFDRYHKRDFYIKLIAIEYSSGLTLKVKDNGIGFAFGRPIRKSYNELERDDFWEKPQGTAFGGCRIGLEAINEIMCYWGGAFFAKNRKIKKHGCSIELEFPDIKTKKLQVLKSHIF